MIKDTWNKCYSSVCSICFYDTSNNLVGSGTGFKVGAHLITNNHVYYAPGSDIVELKFVDSNGYTISKSKRISYIEFKNRLLLGDSESNWDYAIIDLPDLEFVDIPSLKLSNKHDFQIGNEIAVLGFQFDQTNLSIKAGIISSRYTRNGVKYIQIDASVNNGNSGGPLIDISTNEVIGIVTRKHTGLTKSFEKLEESLKTSIDLFTQASLGGSAVFMGINLIESLKLSQEQMSVAVKEIKRSANVGIGFAYELEKILQYFDNN